MGRARDSSGQAAAIGRRRFLVSLSAGALTLAAPRRLLAHPIIGPDAAPPPLWTPPAFQGRPQFSDVAQVEPRTALLFLAGRLPQFPSANLERFLGFSPANILETVDTDVLDDVRARYGSSSLDALFHLMAYHILEELLELYGTTPIVLALDAGHGGLPGVYFDPGSNGTEAWHTRRLVAVVEEEALNRRYAGITIRRIFNDAIGDDFGLPPPEDDKERAAISLRNARGALLAAEVAAWNRVNPQAQVVLHVLSIHFNAGSHGILVLHQGDDVPGAYQQRSSTYARGYLEHVLSGMNGSGLLPYEITRALGTGLHDDSLLYAAPEQTRINPLTGVDRSAFPPRYALLQASLLERDYLDGALRYYRLRPGA